jgi:predicted nucleic acid-binding protein
MIAVDTSVWVDFLHGQPTPPVTVLRELVATRPNEVVLVDVVLTEVLRGLREEDVQRVEQRLFAFPILRLERIADFRAAAGLYRAARRTGMTIRSTIGCLIAAVCIREDVPLLHSDVDFDRLAKITTLRTVQAL